MSRADLQTALRARPTHVSPFLVLGDPTPELSAELARAAVDAGASMLELGFPYSDPCADGPAIQAACRRARAAGVSTPQALRALAAVRRACPGVPLNLLVYGNLVHARGVEAFCAAAAGAGASSLLVPDVPIDEGERLRAACRAAGLATVLLAGPATPPSRLAAMAEACDGFVYLAAHQGVTGDSTSADLQREVLVRRAAATLGAGTPLCVGFGLATAAHVAAAFAAGARIAVVGSHLARVIERHATRDAKSLVDAFRAACAALIPDSPERTPCS